MKNYLTIVLLLATTWTTMMAVPAKPGIKTITQPDGTTLQVQLAGDEWHHSYLTADGLTIERANNGFFYYKTTEGISSFAAHDTGKRNAQELAFINANKEKMTLASQFTSEKQLRQATAKAGLKASQVPQTGSPRIPVILVNYYDVKFKSEDPLAVWSQQIAGTEGVTVYKYFEDQSFGNYKPQFDVYGPYDLPSNRDTYGANVNNWDKGVGLMVAQGCQKADDDVDFSQYDNNGDGKCDVVIVLYAGVGEASSYVTNSVWPCQWDLLSSDYAKNDTLDNTIISKFAVFNELFGYNPEVIDGIGTMCHEFSHCLNLPDFYDTNYGNHFGMGDWSLLDHGCYNNDGYTPCGYTAYERNFMGWFDYSIPEENTTYTIKTVEAGGQAFKITSNNPNEYYIIENIQQTGWNEYAKSSGLQVTHVNYNSSWWSNNSPNNYSKQGMTIIPADNSLKTYYSGGYYYVDGNDEKGDLYPFNDNNELTSTSTPAATLYNSSTNLDKPITNITKNEDGTVSFSYIYHEPEVVEGDVNGDGVCNTADVTALYNWILNNDDSAIVNGDQNNDNVINAGDVTTVYNIILGNENEGLENKKIKYQ